MKILVLNAGSSSQKIHLYDIAEESIHVLPPPTPLWTAQAEWGSTPQGVTLTVTSKGETWTSTLQTEQRTEVLATLLQLLWDKQHAVVNQPADIDIVGHRVVHGGATYRQSVRITPEVLDDLRHLIPFAPLHQLLNLEGIEVVERMFGPIPQIAVFDTTYHRTMPLVAQIYPGPYYWFEQGIRRYGFHGISHQYCARRSAHLLGQDLARLRIVTCHLGSGCSLAATRGGRSIATTMGFTPLEGLMMGTRSGSIDPGILLYVQREHGMTVEVLESLLNHESGLKGISGLSGDMRTILQASARGHQRAQLALDLYIARLRACLGSMIVALEGLDVLTFAGGVGEHSPDIRAYACQGLGFLGITLDTPGDVAGTGDGDRDIASSHASVRVLVVHTEEEWEIARTCWLLHANLLL